MKKIGISLLIVSVLIFGISSYISAEELKPEKVILNESVEVNGDAEVKWRALANGLKYWGKEALKMFMDNGGGMSTLN